MLTYTTFVVRQNSDEPALVLQTLGLVHRCAGPQSSSQMKKGILEQAAVVRDTRRSPATCVLLFQDMENIGSPIASPAVSVLFCDIGDQVGETHCRNACRGACRMVMAQRSFSLSAAI